MEQRIEQQADGSPGGPEPVWQVCESMVEHLATPVVGEDDHWWRFVGVVRDAAGETPLLRSPRFRAPREPSTPDHLHPLRSSPSARTALDSLMADLMRAGWQPLTRGEHWFSARFCRPDSDQWSVVSGQ